MTAPDWLGDVLQMQHATDRQTAERHAQAAADAGVPVTADALMAEWDRQRAAEVTYIYADADDALPAPEDRCPHCGGWGCFTFSDGDDNDRDVECGACDGTGIAS